MSMRLTSPPMNIQNVSIVDVDSKALRNSHNSTRDSTKCTTNKSQMLFPKMLILVGNFIEYTLLQASNMSLVVLYISIFFRRWHFYIAIFSWRSECHTYPDAWIYFIGWSFQQYCHKICNNDVCSMRRGFFSRWYK